MLPLVKRMSKKSAVLLALPLCLGVLLPGCSRAQAPGDAAATASAGAASASETASATPGASGTPLGQTSSPAPEGGGSVGSGEDGSGSGDPEAERQLAPAHIQETAVLESGATITLGELSSTSLSSEEPGEVAGAGVLVPVTVSNPGTEALSLESLVVTFYYGADNTPAPVHPSASESAPASLEAGQSVSFSVAFRVPADSREQVRVVVDLDASLKAAVFEGSAPSA